MEGLVGPWGKGGPSEGASWGDCKGGHVRRWKESDRAGGREGDGLSEGPSQARKALDLRSIDTNDNGVRRRGSPRVTSVVR